MNQCQHWACRQHGHSGGNQGWQGVKRCQLCMQDTFCITQSHIGKQQWVTEFQCVLSVDCCRMVDSAPRWRLSLSWPMQSDHVLSADRMIPPSGRKHSHGNTQYIPGKQVLVRSLLWKIYLRYARHYNSLLISIRLRMKNFRFSP